MKSFVVGLIGAGLLFAGFYLAEVEQQPWAGSITIITALILAGVLCCSIALADALAPDDLP